MSEETPSQSDSFQLQMIELLMRGGLYLPTSSYFIEGEVTPRMAGDLSRALHVLEALGDPITIYLNTPGGDITAGLAMYDMIRACRAKTTIIGQGEIMSMGACILQAADHRVLAPNTFVLVHVGYTGTATDIPENTIRQATAYKKMSDTMYSIIARRLGLGREEMLDRFRYDTFLTAKQAVKAGLADAVMKPARF
jgi:ATP-dependent Clp protease protease subunit